MAVTLTVVQLLEALRMGSAPEETAQATRLLSLTTEAVTKHAPDAPDVVQNEAVIRMAGYLFDQPFMTTGARFANALRNSGAASLLMPYRTNRARSVDSSDRGN